MQGRRPSITLDSLQVVEVSLRLVLDQQRSGPRTTTSNGRGMTTTGPRQQRSGPRTTTFNGRGTTMSGPQPAA